MMLQGALVPAQARLAQVDLMRDFERELLAQSHTKQLLPGDKAPPIIVAATLPLAEAKPGQPRTIAPGKPLARITVKRLDVDDVILAGPASRDDLARGPIMLKQGDVASPVTVVAAHRDTHFLFIRDLREGDVVAMRYVTGEIERYRVTYFETVRWNAFAYPLDPPRPLLALATCYPFGGTEYGGPWRRVAWAERIG
jgi:sortase A